LTAGQGLALDQHFARNFRVFDRSWRLAAAREQRQRPEQRAKTGQTDDRLSETRTHDDAPE
jgi:hypothetical protein